MTKCRWREFSREPSALIFVVLMPALWMFILGLTFSSEQPAQLELGLAPAVAQHSLPVEEILRASPLVKLSIADETVLAEKLLRGELPMYLSLRREDGLLIYKINEGMKGALALKSLVNELIQNYAGRTEQLPTKTDIIRPSSSRYIDFLIPGLLALSLFTTSLFGTGMTLVSARRENLLKRYAATPQSPTLFILSHVLGRFLIFVLEFLSVMLCGVLFFSFHIEGDFATFLGLSLLGVAVFTAIAMLLSSRMKNTGAYNGVANLVVLTMMLPAGVWFPRHYLPDWFANLAAFLPLTALVDALRGVSLDGLGLWSVMQPVMVLLAYLFLAGILARRTFKFY